MSNIKIKQNAFEGLDYNESVNFYFEKKKEYNEQKEIKIKNLLAEKSDNSAKKQKYENTDFTCSIIASSNKYYSHINKLTDS